MKICFAGIENKINCKILAEENVPNVLGSFNILKKNNLEVRDVVKAFGKRPEIIIIDSSAYSVATSGAFVSRYEYSEFLKRNYRWYDHCINLDVIYNAEESLKNQKFLEEEGLHPLPVFHFGSDFKYLRYYSKRYDLVCLGGIATLQSNVSLGWFEKCFRILRKDKTKAHACGIGSPTILKKFDWFSCDTLDWLCRNGQIFVPDGNMLKRIRFSSGPVALYKPIIQGLRIDYKKLDDDKEKSRLNVRSFLWFEQQLSKRQSYW
jgi:hypothetical protein